MSLCCLCVCPSHHCHIHLFLPFSPPQPTTILQDCLFFPWRDLAEELESDPKIVTTAAAAAGAVEGSNAASGEGEGEGEGEGARALDGTVEAQAESAAALPEPAEPVSVPFLMDLPEDFGADMAGDIEAHPAYAESSGSGSTTAPAWLSARFRLFDAENVPGNSNSGNQEGGREEGDGEGGVGAGAGAGAGANNNPLAGFLALDAHRCFVACEYIRDTLKFFEPYVRDDGTTVGSVVTALKHCTGVAFLFRAEPWYESGGGTVALDGLLVEVLLQRVLQAGTAGGAITYEHRVLYEACRARQESVPALLAASTGVLFELVPAMDSAVVRSLASWLSYHLVNFKLAWPYWAHYGSVWTGEGEDEVSPRLVTLIHSCLHSFIYSFTTALQHHLLISRHPTHFVLFVAVLCKYQNV